MASKERRAQMRFSSTCKFLSARLLILPPILASLSLWLPQSLAAPLNNPSNSPSGRVPRAAATDIVSPIPPVHPPSSTHLTTYGILGIVISGVLVATAATGYALRYWKRYKRSRLPPSAQYRESLRVAAREADEAAAAAGQGAPAPAPVAGGSPVTREVAGAAVVAGDGAGAGASAAAQGAKTSGQAKEKSAKRSSSGAGAEGSARRQGSSKSERTHARTSRSENEKKSRAGLHTSGSKRVASESAARASGPGPSTQALTKKVTFVEIEEIPR